MPLITMPTMLTAILVALFMCVTLYVVFGREVALHLMRWVVGALVRQVRAIRRRRPLSTTTAKEATGG